MGFVRTYAHSIVFGPRTHGGIRAIDLTTKQGIMIIYEVMRTIRTPGHGQELLRIFLRKFQHTSGLSLPLLEYPDKRAPHLEGYYYVYLRNFLTAHGCQLEFACIPTPVLEREQDLMIMDVACNKPKEVLSNADINKIHYCRSYLQIHQLFDMCTANGNYILDTVVVDLVDVGVA